MGRHGFSCRRFRESEEYANLRNEVLVVNLTMAKALDLTLPPLIQSQADEVIELAPVQVARSPSKVASHHQLANSDICVIDN